jgi:hypothetical protein
MARVNPGRSNGRQGGLLEDETIICGDDNQRGNEDDHDSDQLPMDNNTAGGD